MAKLPCIQGMRDSRNITVKFADSLYLYIEQQCRKDWLELNRIEHPNDNFSPFIPASDWLATTEGSTHKMLFDVYFLNDSLLEQSELSRMLARLQARRYNVQGTRKRFEERARSATAYRKYRNWWINRHYLKLLGAEYLEPCPFSKYVPPTPPESYITIGEHFEEWTQYKLPDKAWAMLRNMESKREERLAAVA